jgi:uncharacterized membrane protein YkoI
MELKAIAGDRDLYDIMKKQRKKQKTVDAAAAEHYAKKKALSSAPVFDFINVKLGKKSGTVDHTILPFRAICFNYCNKNS